MAKSRRSGNSYKAQYQGYKGENRWLKNKKRRLEKRIRENENDIGAVEALKKVNAGEYTYSRNRKSSGHICKIDPFLVKVSSVPHTIPAGEQMVNLGLINEKKYTNSIRRRK